MISRMAKLPDGTPVEIEAGAVNRAGWIRMVAKVDGRVVATKTVQHTEGTMAKAIRAAAKVWAEKLRREGVS